MWLSLLIFSCGAVFSSNIMGGKGSLGEYNNEDAAVWLETNRYHRAFVDGPHWWYPLSRV